MLLYYISRFSVDRRKVEKTAVQKCMPAIVKDLPGMTATTRFWNVGILNQDEYKRIMAPTEDSAITELLIHTIVGKDNFWVVLIKFLRTEQFTALAEQLEQMLQQLTEGVPVFDPLTMEID